MKKAIITQTEEWKFEVLGLGSGSVYEFDTLNEVIDFLNDMDIKQEKIELRKH